ncbi:thiol:disulfide interchange protein DsbC [Mesocricetibacter intestinalis]|uniref:Thiol:disulfide interchange protein n=1 Tax=Mesocricetibacter intestinalis TaxID=1521930 RepID=A0A4R6VAV3_9PAST|nr:bifunctional protein-disulfide isomerase/oxidoreductase DsbC [Mesocricetibacter intestinalis]TDQ57024.1 thiol:disulfide interchange protein DsbC [Mesocricetibacter intestinalis]
MQKFLTALFLSLIAGGAAADDAALKAKLKNLGADNIEIKNSPLQGIKQVLTDNGILYVSEDGKYVLQGRLYELKNNEAVDLNTQALMPLLESYKSEMIIYPAKKEKYVVSVFMDITCHYCRKLHSQIKEYNDLGITLRFLAFPRGGTDSQVAQVMESVFTAPDPAFAFSQAEQGTYPKTLKTPNIVKKHYRLGVLFGLQGTPYIVTSKGEGIGGYLAPKDLLQALQNGAGS